MKTAAADPVTPPPPAPGGKGRGQKGRGQKGRGTAARLIRIALIVGALLSAASITWVVIYRVVLPPVTPLMLLRRWDGAGTDHDPVPLARISPLLATAVIASEDARFCSHHGFDWAAMRAAWRHDHGGGHLRGGSTISMQTAKNAFLWPGRTYLRKGVEAWFTVLIEALWPKSRIMAVYLNSIEWGDGVYGAEAAARRHFHHPAATLDRREAALLAAVLPDPRRWSPERPSPYVRARAATILGRMAEVERDGLGHAREDGCVRDPP